MLKLKFVMHDDFYDLFIFCKIRVYKLPNDKIRL